VAAAAASLTLALWKRAAHVEGKAKGGTPCGVLERCAQLLLHCTALAARVADAALQRCWRWQAQRRVLVLGLDNAGKTAFCNALSYRRGHFWPSSEPRPDHHVLHHHATWRGFKLHLIDPTGKPTRHQQHRLALWEELLKCRPDAVIFVVDAADSSRHEEAQEALHWVLRHPALRDLPVLVLGTKIDLRSAVETWDLRCGLGLAGLSREQRAALLGRTMLSQGMPFELRHRIAGFHPNQAASPPHGGPLAMRMCSLKRRGSLSAGVQWLVESMRSESKTTEQEDGRRCTLISDAVQVLGQSVCGNKELSRQAALLPVYEA